MKKLNYFSVGLILFVQVICVNQASAQASQNGKDEGKPIPAEVLKIVEKSCGSCHTEPGNLKALSHINFSKWDSYSSVEQAAKAMAMCEDVTKKQIQAKKSPKENQVNTPTSDEIKTICDWAQSLQVTKK